MNLYQCRNLKNGSIIELEALTEFGIEYIGIHYTAIEHAEPLCDHELAKFQSKFLNQIMSKEAAPFLMKLACLELFINMLPLQKIMKFIYALFLTSYVLELSNSGQKNPSYYPTKFKIDIFHTLTDGHADNN